MPDDLLALEAAVQVKELATKPPAESLAQRALFSQWLPHPQLAVNCSAQQRDERPIPTPLLPASQAVRSDTQGLEHSLRAP